MKNIKILLALLLTTILLIGCKKSTTEIQGRTLLFKQNLDNVKKNEPISLTFGDDSSSEKVIWSTTPNAKITIATIANNATINFENAGIYTITATSGSVYAQYLVTVDDIEFTPDYGTNFSMTASKLVNISINEPVAFSVHNSTNGTQIIWSVTTSNPSLVYMLHANNAKRTEETITFTGATGYATVYANDGVNTQRRTVWIGGSSHNTLFDTANFLLGDKLQLTPSLVQTSNEKKLVITATTLKKYNCSTDNILSFSNNNDYQIDYAGVNISHTTCSTRGVANCVNSFKNIQVGNHFFKVNFGNKTYSGKLCLTAAGKYTFTWQDNSVVNISPLVLQ